MKIDRFTRRHARHLFTPDRDLYFPYGRIAFARAIRWWHEEAHRRGRIEHASLPSVTAILQSYARPWNIDPMARMLLRFTCIERVIISNNNPRVDLRRHLAVADGRLTVIDQPHERPASMMAMLALRASERGAERFVSIDDDLLLFPAQIIRLLGGLSFNPTMPHGVVGQRVDRLGGAVEHHVMGDMQVDVLNRAYAFTAAHVRRYAELLDALGYETDEQKETLPFGSDIVLSFSGDARPRVHAVGSLLSCPTAALPGVARFREPGFASFRADLLARLHAFTPR